MSVEIKVVFSTIAEAAAFMSQFREGQRATPLPEIKAEKEQKDAAQPEKPKAEKAAVPKTEKPASTGPSAEPVQTAAPASAEVTYEKSGLPEKIQKGVAAGKRTEVVALMGEFGAKRGADLKSADFAAFGAKIDALLAEESLA